MEYKELKISNLLHNKNDCQNKDRTIDEVKKLNYSSTPINIIKFKSNSHIYHKCCPISNKETLTKENLSLNKNNLNFNPIIQYDTRITPSQNNSYIPNIPFAKNNLYYFQHKQQTNVSKGKNWTKEEDEKLVNLIEKSGPGQWNIIAQILGTRSAKQCRDHYVNCLNPNIKKSLWTKEEDELLLMKYTIYGTNWSKIKKFFPGRTCSMIKNHLYFLLKE